MTLRDQVSNTLAEEEKNREENPDFRSLRDFYQTMKKEGVAIKQPYTLPLVDTVGRHLYEVEQPPVNKR